MGRYLTVRLDKAELSIQRVLLILGMYERVMRGLVRNQPQAVKEEVRQAMKRGAYLEDRTTILGELWQDAVGKGVSQGREEANRDFAISLLASGVSKAELRKFLRGATAEDLERYYEEFAQNQEEYRRRFQEMG